MDPTELADAYLAALVSRDPAGVPFTEDVCRINNGRSSAVGADDLREAIRREPPLTIGAGRRWVVAKDEVVVFFDLSAEVGNGAPIPACIGERFMIRDGSIAEIEAVHTVAPGSPTGWLDTRAENDPEPGVEAAVRSYLDALISHAAGDVRLTPDARRVENGKRTGDSDVELRASLESEIMHSVLGISDERWLLAGDSATVFYSLMAGSPSGEMMLRVAERFRVRDGALTEIEAVFAPTGG